MNQHGSEPPEFVQIFSYVWIVVSESLQVSSLPDDVSDDVRASASRRSSALGETSLLLRHMQFQVRCLSFPNTLTD